MKGEWVYQIEDIIEKQIKQNSTQSSTYDKILDICDEQDHQIELLNKRWELLKDYINGFKEYNIEEANMAWKITDKMQELEQEKI